MLPSIVLTLVATAALIVAEKKKSQPGKWLFKPTASAGFVWAAFAAGALDSDYGKAMLVGFVLCFVGDLFLIPKSRKSFLIGLCTFLLGHVGFAAAFVVRGVDPRAVAVGAVVLAIVAKPIHAWLMPHVEARMRVPVLAYLVVISSMVALACGAAVPSGACVALIGAVTFYLSDITVARDRFVDPGFVNRLVGLPLYYGAQLILAWSIT